MDIQTIIENKTSRYSNIKNLLKIYNYELIKETQIYISENNEQCNEYIFNWL